MFIFKSINRFNTDVDRIADPVEFVLGADNDGDGLPSFYESLLGSSDNNTDSDNDSLIDGYGPRGEMTYATSPIKADTGDGLNDIIEITGWEL